MFPRPFSRPRPSTWAPTRFLATLLVSSRVQPQILIMMQQQRMMKRGGKPALKHVKVGVRAMTTARALIRDALSEVP